MRKQFYLRGLLLWALFIGITFLVGILRVRIFETLLGYAFGYYFAAVLVAVVCYWFAYRFLKKHFDAIPNDCQLIGVVWGVLALLLQSSLIPVSLDGTLGRYIVQYLTDRGRVWGEIPILFILIPLLICHYLDKNKTRKNVQ